MTDQQKEEIAIIELYNLLISLCDILILCTPSEILMGNISITVSDYGYCIKNSNDYVKKRNVKDAAKVAIQFYYYELINKIIERINNHD